MLLNTDQILSLAPDASSAKAGSQLASPAKWDKLGRSETATWGECKGSGKDPYRTQIDLGEPAFKCSCPSRKFPCKHGLALYLLLAQDSALFAAVEAPPWVSDWLRDRQQRAEKKRSGASEPPAAKTEEQSAASAATNLKRAEKRENKVASGLAGRIRRAGKLCFQSGVQDWSQQLGRELAGIYMLGDAYARHDAAAIDVPDRAALLPGRNGVLCRRAGGAAIPRALSAGLVRHDGKHGRRRLAAALSRWTAPARERIVPPCLALAGSQRRLPVTLAGEWDGRAFAPWSVWADGRLYNFESDFCA